ncbi:hypothetical protein [uncultured Arcobacter sp.]|uniref:hypothetical protein n=1 Tax=uncultured Arcobacter sp. TaxID=165434 RepID=UPI00263490FB|nr:hypothetical protein [uncultured Arcobacter sp.]
MFVQVSYYKRKDYPNFKDYQKVDYVELEPERGMSGSMTVHSNIDGKHVIDDINFDESDVESVLIDCPVEVELRNLLYRYREEGDKDCLTYENLVEILNKEG